MKKHHVTAIIAAILIIVGMGFGKFNKDYFFGILTGLAIFLLLATTLGQWLAAKATERMDKLHRDRMEEDIP